ncbi:MAG TPA: MlaD family protein [Labilithrix sp.]|nr:MlaD family protein [Labilithrix sp.]
MSASTTHFKLGIFTALALAAALVVAFGLGWHGVASADTVRYHTYFDETVQGLEIGSPVKFRGVLIGSVAGIKIAPDRKHVDVALSLNTADTRALGLAERTPELRAQLGTQGITGVKFIDIDLFDPRTNPAPQLSFRPAENYIPARVSFMKGLEDKVEVLSQRLPELVDTTVATLQRIEVILVDFHGQRLPDRMGKAIDNIDGAVSDMRRLIRHLDGAQIPDKTAAAIDSLTAAVAKVNTVLEGIGGDGGLVASTQRATDSIGDLGRSTSGSAARLERTLRDLDEAAVAIRALADAIDRDPDMLVKGRAKARRP